MTLPDHLSYSALSSYQKCPRQFKLSRVDRMTPRQAWYFATGTAVHNVVEGYLKDFLDRDVDIREYAEELFIAEVERLMKIEPDTHAWAHAGSDKDPVIEEKALTLAQDCAEEAIAQLELIDVWECELEVTGHLAPCPVPIQGFADIVGEHKKHGPIIGDWKTGKSKPKDNLQLETYHALLHGPDQICKARRWSAKAGAGFKGLWLMVNPEAAKARPVTLKESPKSMGLMYADAWRKIERGVFPARVQYSCKFCLQEHNCKTMPGRDG